MASANPSTRKLADREIETINVARQTDRIDRASGGTANDPERVGSISWKNPCDGTQYTNLIRRSRTASTQDQRDARSLDTRGRTRGHDSMQTTMNQMTRSTTGWILAFIVTQGSHRVTVEQSVSG